MQQTITVCDYCNGTRRPAVDSLKVVSAVKGAFTVDVCREHLERVMPVVGARRRKEHASHKRTRPTFSREQKAAFAEKIKDHRKAGLSYYEIAQKLGVSESTVYRLA